MQETEKDREGSLGLSKDDLEALFASTFDQIANKDIIEAEKTPPNITQNTPFFDANSEGKNQDSKIKSSLRLKYDAEVLAITKQHGNLEDIRRKLGLSKRKIAQMLLVDPSAWTRWTSADGEAPPHIYRALEWYLLLQDKHPEYKSSLWLNSVARPQLSQHEIENIKKSVMALAQRELPNREVQMERLNRKIRMLILSQLLVLAIAALIAIF